MEHRPLSLGELLRQDLTLPITLHVVRGYQGCDKLRSVDSGARIRLHFYREETVLRGRVERGNQQLTIPLHCEELFELLPSIPELDDMRYETVRQLLFAHPMPSKVRVTQGWRGDRDENTIQENDELEDIKSIDDCILGPCLLANRVIETEDRVLKKERVCISYEAAAHFTTEADHRKRYRAINLVHNQQPLPQRVRVHSFKRETRLPAVPVKVKLMETTTLRMAVCSDMENGRLFLLPESLDDVLVRVQLMPTNTREDKSQTLYMGMEVVCLPKIGPQPFDFIFKTRTASSCSKEIPQMLTVLMPSCKDCVGTPERHLPDYRTFATLGAVETQDVGTSVVHVNSRESKNVMTRNCKLQNESFQLQSLLNASDKVDVETDQYYEVVDMKEESGSEDDCYDYVDNLGNLPEMKPQNTTRSLSTTDTDLQYGYVDQEIKAVQLRNPPRPPTRPPQSRHSLQEQKLQQLSVMKNKLVSLKKENERLEKQISKQVQVSDQLTSQVQTMQADGNQDINEIDPNTFSQWLQSLSNVEVIRLLENLRLDRYVNDFLQAEVEAHELSGCDRAYLEDVGMKPAHAVKLLTVLQGRLPPGVQWENLLQ